MGGVSQLKSKIKKLSRTSFEIMRGQRHSVVYMGRDGTILWDDRVNYHDGVLAVPLPMPAEEWEATQ